MTEGSRKVFEFLKDNYGTKLTTADIATSLGVTGPVVTGSVNGLTKKKYAVRTKETFPGDNGKEVTVTFISLTEAGLSYDPVAEEEAKLAAKEAAKAAKAAAKAAAADAE